MVGCMRKWLVICAVPLLLAQFCTAQQQGELVVDDLARCKVKNVLIDSKHFEYDKLEKWINATSSLPNSSSCEQALLNLTTCSSDGDGGSRDSSKINTLRIKEGCCSKKCADAVKEALVKSGRGCYRKFLEAACNSTELPESQSAVLFSAVKRCIGLNASCDQLNESGSLLPPELEAQAPASERSSTDKGSSDNSSSGNGSSDSSSSNSSADSASGDSTPPYVSIAPPDPFQLVPQTPSGVVLATPEEILAVAMANHGSSQRRRP